MSRLCRIDLVCLVLIALLFSVLASVSSAWAARAPRVAVLPFEAKDVSESTADFLAEFLREELGRAIGIEVVSAEGQPRGCFSVDCGVRTAAKIGADRVVLGRARVEGSEYRLELRIVDRGTRAELVSVAARSETEDGLFPRAGDILGELQEILRQPLQEAPPPEKSPAAPPESLLIVHTKPANVRVGDKLYLEARVSPALGTRRFELIYENAKGVRGTVACGDAGEARYLAEIPGAVVTAGVLRYYFRILEGGQEVAREPQLGFLEVTAVPGEAPTPPKTTPGTSTPSETTPDESTKRSTAPIGSSDQRESGGSKKLWWIAGIAGATAVAVVTLGGGGDGGGDDGGEDPPPDRTLPEPPEH